MAGDIKTIQDAVELVFEKKGVVSGYCAGWVYSMANTFDKGTFRGEGGGNCGEQQYIDSLERVGWNIVLHLEGISQDEVIRRTCKEHDYQIGAIIMYKCQKPTGYKNKKDGTDHPNKYGHTQLYLGGTSPQDKCGWTTSCRNNYGSGFVYRKYGKTLPWDFWVFERNGVPSSRHNSRCSGSQNVSFGDSNFKKPTNDAEKLDCSVKLARYFMSKLGLSEIQAAAICGNLWVESKGFDPMAQYINKQGVATTIGLAQWQYVTNGEPGRAVKLQNFAQTHNLDYRTFDCQRQFVVEELKNNTYYRTRVLTPLLAETDIEVATRDIVGWKYETYEDKYDKLLKNKTTPMRIERAKRTYNAMHKGG